jgi:hypothetical protein
MTGVSVQVGPRSVGRRCTAWGLVIARGQFPARLIAIAVAFEVVLAVTMILLSNAAQGDSVPAIFTPPPTVFCPSGQHVTGVSASGRPDCALNH